MLVLALLVALVGVSAQMCPRNNCVSFIIGSGTGCDWMCDYCADALGPSYYFTTPVCTYTSGGCTGSPISGGTYTCCSLSDD